MIGVVVTPAEQDAVREFFELFKTPWEFYRDHSHYDVVVCTQDFPEIETAKLVVYYAARHLPFDEHHKTVLGQENGCEILFYRGERLPIYGSVAMFSIQGESLFDNRSQESAGYVLRSSNTVVARVGYNLFAEVRKLLTAGQPVANAHIATLELHISLLRNLIKETGISFVEVPPIPEGYRFIACLTHDVDHPSIRRHRCDHTTFGFLYRAVFSSLQSFIRGCIPFRNLVKNWLAAFTLPFVYLKLLPDFWSQFDDRYRELEKDICSTFFIIPFRNYSGATRSGKAAKFRAASYGAKDIARTVDKLIASGCEVGVHGIDAWIDSLRGREELDEIRTLAGISDIGIRMHWLYYDEHSATILEEAGAAYDSTVGYNETVGFRAGTTQSFKPFQATSLMELPMHVMDTALFYPAYLALSPIEARSVLDRMIDNVSRFGGCLTVNWHDRSVFPERLWDESYSELISKLKQGGGWFATSVQAVNWFKKRRSVFFENAHADPGSISATISGNHRDNLPGLRLRLHRPSITSLGVVDGSEYFDVPFDTSDDAIVACAVRGGGIAG